jgi:hypothetical protein
MGILNLDSNNLALPGTGRLCALTDSQLQEF